jgi:hypothetical protein
MRIARGGRTKGADVLSNPRFNLGEVFFAFDIGEPSIVEPP